MKLSIDAAQCTGHGRCWTVAPELFDCDDSGNGVVKQETVDEGQVQLARHAVASCPEGAITLHAN